jgi:anhydro-N-acetylmuramic acid kinase
LPPECITGFFMHGQLTAIGLMSGTSMDGVDAALLVTDGETVNTHGPACGRPYRPEERRMLRRAMGAAAGMERKDRWPAILHEAARLVENAHVEAVRTLLERAGRSGRGVDVIGFHGQTVIHRPGQRWTVQIGEGERLAARLGITVVDQFRLDDVAAGGEGAPLAPLYHSALAGSANLPLPVAVVNVGGVANISWLWLGGDILAFDTGPGNALIDDWVRRHTGNKMDKDGALAGAGRVDAMALARLLDNPFFARTPPKSLDRNAFHSTALAGLSPADGAATLTEFTAAALEQALAHLPAAPRRWIICGGGRHNSALMEALARRLPGQVTGAEAMGWRGDMLEAEAFAFLGVRALRRLPLSLPGTTGVSRPMTGGRIHPP